jgi:hypothetical protein
MSELTKNEQQAWDQGFKYGAEAARKEERERWQKRIEAACDGASRADVVAGLRAGDWEDWWMRRVLLAILDPGSET